MPWSMLMVTGGVEPTEANLTAWIKAGVTCVGMGSNLFPAEILATKNWDEITRMSKEVIDIINKARV